MKALRSLKPFLILKSIAQMMKLAWRAYPSGVAGVVLLNIASGLVPVATAWITKLIFDSLGASIQAGTLAPFSQSLLLLLVLQAAITIANRAIMPITSYLHSETARRLSLSTKSAIYTKINDLSGLAPFEDRRFYDTIQLAASGAERGPSNAISISMTLLRSAITISSLIAILVAFNPLLALAVSLTVLPYLYSHLKMSQQRFQLSVGNVPKERYASYYGQVLSTVQFAKEVRLFNLGGYFLDKLLSTFEQIYRAQRSQQKSELGRQITLGLITSIVASAAFVSVIIEATTGRITIGDVILYMSAITSLQESLLSIVVALANVNENILFYRYYTDLLEMPQPLPLTKSPKPVRKLVRGIEFCNVWFRYGDEHPWVLRGLNLRIPANRCTALVGLNGAGKTTLVKLLTRMYDPNEGRILWEGIDIREFDLQSLRQSIGTIFQDFTHYDLTAQENIGLGNVNEVLNNHKVQQAAMRAGVSNTIEALPHGYGTVLSRWLTPDNSGVDLSGGEWQKIALARMFMKDSDVLILDEPTAALDAQAEYDLYSHFVELMGGRTSLLITHRFSTVRMADVVAVLEDGQVTEVGSHEDLISLNRTYKKLYHMQAERYL